MLDVNQIWYQSSIISKILYPVSLIYRYIVFVRRLAYRIGFFKKTRFNIPVIVVGNLTVGGTGKTPLLIQLVNELTTKGFHPGVVTRGYRGNSSHWPQIVTADSDPYSVGDEAVLIAQKTKVPIAAGYNRVEAVRTLLAAYFCDVIFSDDGLQHEALHRDIEIVVIDGERRLGNELCLPAGPLREPVSRLKTVDFVVVNGALKSSDEIKMSFVPDVLVNLKNHTQRIFLNDCIGKKIIAICGIGNPNRFFETLRSAGLTISTRIFPDHFSFQKKDIDLDTDAMIVMTEKDAVKCQHFADERHWMLEGHAVIEERLVKQIVDQLTISNNVITMN